MVRRAVRIRELEEEVSMLKKELSVALELRDQARHNQELAEARLDELRRVLNQPRLPVFEPIRIDQEPASPLTPLPWVPFPNTPSIPWVQPQEPFTITWGKNSQPPVTNSAAPRPDTLSDLGAREND